MNKKIMINPKNKIKIHRYLHMLQRGGYNLTKHGLEAMLPCSMITITK